MTDRYQVLRDMGIEDPEAFLEAQRSKVATRGDLVNVCVCGHTEGAHKGQGVRDHECSQGKIVCPCKFYRPVIRVSNAKFFRFLNAGHRENHALMRGIAKSLSYEKTDIKIEWITPLGCDVPECDSVVAAPYGFNKKGELSFEWAAVTSFFCSAHMREVEQMGHHHGADAIRASFGLGPVGGV